MDVPIVGIYLPRVGIAYCCTDGVVTAALLISKEISMCVKMADIYII